MHSFVVASAIAAQSDDNFCEFARSVLSGRESSASNSHQKFIVKNKVRFTVSNGALLFDGAIVVPKSNQEEVLSTYHEGHFGKEKMLFRLRPIYWWYRLPSDCSAFASRCLECARGKSSGGLRPSLGSLPSPGPYELVFLDIVGPLPSYSGFQFILTMEDSFTKFVKAIPLRSITAENVATKFKEDWIGTFHAPCRVHSDNGPQFTSSMFQSFCNSLGISASRSTPYHPQGNGRLERFHRTLKERLRCCREVRNWPANLVDVLLAYNSTVHSATGFSPFQMTFGFQPRPPGDWSAAYTRGDCPLTADLHRIWNECKVGNPNGTHGAIKKALAVGDMVFVRVPGGHGLGKIWDGPKPITKIVGPTTVEVGGSEKVHVVRLKFFKRGEECGVVVS